MRFLGWWYKSGLLGAFAMLLVIPAICQSQTATPARILDTNTFNHPSADSLRVLDSIYRAKKAELAKWELRQSSMPEPSNDFISAYATIGTLMQIRASDINQYFSERAGRPKPVDDRGNFSGVDRALSLGARASIAPEIEVFVEYEYLGRWYNTIVDSTALPALSGVEEELDLTTHSLMTGARVTMYNSRFYRLCAVGGIGAAIAFVSEHEGASTSRSSSATGIQINFEIANEFRFAHWGSFLLDLTSRILSTSELKQSGGATLTPPFGLRPTPQSISPRASYAVAGLTVGVVAFF